MLVKSARGCLGAVLRSIPRQRYVVDGVAGKVMMLRRDLDFWRGGGWTTDRRMAEGANRPRGPAFKASG